MTLFISSIRHIRKRLNAMGLYRRGHVDFDAAVSAIQVGLAFTLSKSKKIFFSFKDESFDKALKVCMASTAWCRQISSWFVCDDYQSADIHVDVDERIGACLLRKRGYSSILGYGIFNMPLLSLSAVFEFFDRNTGRLSADVHFRSSFAVHQCDVSHI